MRERLLEADNFGEVEEHMVRIGAGEYLAQIVGGIPMSQGEIVRLSDLGLVVCGGRGAHQRRRSSI